MYAIKRSGGKALGVMYVACLMSACFLLVVMHCHCHHCHLFALLLCRHQLFVDMVRNCATPTQPQATETTAEAECTQSGRVPNRPLDLPSYGKNHMQLDLKDNQQFVQPNGVTDRC